MAKQTPPKEKLVGDLETLVTLLDEGKDPTLDMFADEPINEPIDEPIDEAIDGPMAALENEAEPAPAPAPAPAPPMKRQCSLNLQHRSQAPQALTMQHHYWHHQH